MSFCQYFFKQAHDKFCRAKVASGRDDFALWQRDFDLLNHALRHRSPAEVQLLQRLDLHDRLHLLVSDLSSRKIEYFYLSESEHALQVGSEDVGVSQDQLRHVGLPSDEAQRSGSENLAPVISTLRLVNEPRGSNFASRTRIASSSEVRMVSVAFFSRLTSAASSVATEENLYSSRGSL